MRRLELPVWVTVPVSQRPSQVSQMALPTVKIGPPFLTMFRTFAIRLCFPA